MLQSVRCVFSIVRHERWVKRSREARKMWTKLVCELIQSINPLSFAPTYLYNIGGFLIIQLLWIITENWRNGSEKNTVDPFLRKHVLYVNCTVYNKHDRTLQGFLLRCRTNTRVHIKNTLLTLPKWPSNSRNFTMITIPQPMLSWQPEILRT